MKYLYYNPIEPAEKIRIKSRCFEIDTEYEPWASDLCDKPVYIDELFKLAALDCFENVQVYLTTHCGAYWKNKKAAFVGTRITGWVSLKEYKNGGGYLEDQYISEIQ
jgi:hypothetical protein